MYYGKHRCRRRISVEKITGDGDISAVSPIGTSHGPFSLPPGLSRMSLRITFQTSPYMRETVAI